MSTRDEIMARMLTAEERGELEEVIAEADAYLEGNPDDVEFAAQLELPVRLLLAIEAGRIES